MNTNTRANEAVTGFVCGAVIGAGVALLLAPANGRDTRRKIGDTARRLGEGVNGKLAGIKESVANRASDIKESVGSRASEIKGDVREAIDAGRTAASNASISKR